MAETTQTKPETKPEPKDDAGEAAKKKADAKTRPEPKDDAGLVRVATTHGAASECIQVGTEAVMFATGNVDGQRGRISEEITPAIAEQLLANPIFQPITVPADQVAALESQIERNRHGQVASAVLADEKDGTIEELQRANRALAADRDALRKRIAELEAKVGAK